jgi:hypothetical protein
MACRDTLQTYQEASQPLPKKPPDVRTAATCKINKVMSSLQDFFGVLVRRLRSSRFYLGKDADPFEPFLLRKTHHDIHVLDRLS